MLLLLCQNILPTATARAGFTRCGARTRDHRREATLLLLLLLLVLQTNAAVRTVAVVWAYARKNCASDLWVEGIHTRRGTHQASRLRSEQALTSTVSQQ